MEIKPLVIGLGTQRRLVLHFVELDLREQRVLVSLTVKDRWLQVKIFGVGLRGQHWKRLRNSLSLG